jgi:hypothetical protein
METKSNNKENSLQEDEKPSIGFQTASGRSIPPPSKEAIQKSMHTMKDIQEYIPAKSTTIESPSPPVLKGFTTASGKELTPPSEQARLKALALLNGDDTDEQDQKDKPVMKGFETALGKTLKPVSEKAKARADALFKQPEQEKAGSVNVGFKTASGKKLADPSKESIQFVAAILEETDEQSKGEKRPFEEPLNADYKYENVLNQYGGFQMAHSRKGIQVSVGAKRQAISIFEEREVPDIPTTTKEQDFNVTSIFKSNGTSSNSSSYPTVPDMNPLKPPDSNTTTVSKKLEEKPTATIPSLPKRNKRVSAIQKGNKPFKSPIIKSNLELTKAAVKNKNINKAKGTSVFDLTSSKLRYYLYIQLCF